MTWIFWLFVIGSLGYDAVNVLGQRVAPGVPPQQYQQYQPPPPPHQHVPVQQQQVPVQPQDHGHNYHRDQPQDVLNANMAQEKHHITEHLDVPIDTAKMTEEELQFHYFKMHDADNNNKLDGCEMIQSLIHWHGENNNNPPHDGPAGGRLFTDDELAAIIDPVLNANDVNRDGCIDYPEFIQVQKAAAARQQL